MDWAAPNQCDIVLCHNVHISDVHISDSLPFLCVFCLFLCILMYSYFTVCR